MENTTFSKEDQARAAELIFQIGDKNIAAPRSISQIGMNVNPYEYFFNGQHTTFKANFKTLSKIVKDQENEEEDLDKAIGKTTRNSSVNPAELWKELTKLAAARRLFLEEEAKNKAKKKANAESIKQQIADLKLLNLNQDPEARKKEMENLAKELAELEKED